MNIEQSQISSSATELVQLISAFRPTFHKCLQLFQTGSHDSRNSKTTFLSSHSDPDEKYFQDKAVGYIHVAIKIIRYSSTPWYHNGLIRKRIRAATVFFIDLLKQISICYHRLSICYIKLLICYNRLVFCYNKLVIW